MVILKWVLMQRGVRMWTGLMWLRIRYNGEMCEHGSRPSGSIKGSDQLNDYLLLKMDSAPWSYLVSY
jgi:hypothetical protein